MQAIIPDTGDQAVSVGLVRVCKSVLESVVVDPSVEIYDVSVASFRSSRFDSFQMRTIFIVCITTSDASMVRGEPSLYKGSYKERIEGALDYYAKSILADCEVHVEIDGPNHGSVERMIPVDLLTSSGRLSSTSPIVETARRFSIPEILVRGRHFIAPSPTIASYLESLLEEEPVGTALDLFGGTGLTAAVLCSEGNPDRVRVVEKERSRLEKMKEYLKDQRVEFVLGDSFSYDFDQYDLVVADPYYEDAMRFLDARLDEILQKTRIFLFIPGKIEDICWNVEIERKLRRACTTFRKWDAFGQVLFDVRK
jgi:hypothetical protein